MICNLNSATPIWPSRDPVSICMPICNEVDVIQIVVQEWIDEVFKYLPSGSEFIFDEAGSTDGTKEALLELKKKYPFIRVNFHDAKDGFANATKRLYQEAHCPWIFCTDSDGQYIACDFWKLAKQIEHNYDLIRGAKIGRKDPLFRRIASLFFNKIIWFLFNMNFLDFNSTFFLIKKNVLDQILPHINCMETLINTELLLRTELENYNIKQIYILHRPRRFGVSRGLHPITFIKHSIKALIGLFKIKASYRTQKL